MASIHIHRNHTLGVVAAKREVEEIARNLKSKLDISYRWVGDDLQFQRSGANGSIAVTETTVTVVMELSGGLSLFKGMVEREVNGYLDTRLR
jgi:putative polyhydroxyalkanoate system protein